MSRMVVEWDQKIGKKNVKNEKGGRKPGSGQNT